MSPLKVLLTLLHPSSIMSWLFVHPAPGWEETNVASNAEVSVRHRLRQEKKMGQNWTRWLGSEKGKEEES